MKGRVPGSLMLSLIAGLAVTTSVDAQQVGSPPAEKEAGPWSGKAALGYLATSGNTESSSLNSGFSIAYASGRWLHGLEGLAIYSAQDEVTTAEAYDLVFARRLRTVESPTGRRVVPSETWAALRCTRARSSRRRTRRGGWRGLICRGCGWRLWAIWRIRGWRGRGLRG